MQMKRAKSYNVKKLNPKWFGTLFTFDHRLKGQHKTNCLQLTFSSRFIYIGNKQICKHHAGSQIMTCRWLKHRYLPYTYVSPEKMEGVLSIMRRSKTSSNFSVVIFLKNNEKETLNPRFFFYMSTSERFTLLFTKTINPVCLL